MKHVLYILPLTNNKAFKVGITNNNDFSRIKHLNMIYKFNLSESYIVESDKIIIKSLERQLLSDYSFYKYEIKDKTDGHSEFLKKDCINDILEEINFKSRLGHIGITIKKGIELPKNNIKVEKPIKIKKDFSEINEFIKLMGDNPKDYPIKRKNTIKMILNYW